jgi:hypothetical protein
MYTPPEKDRLPICFKATSRQVVTSVLDPIGQIMEASVMRRERIRDVVNNDMDLHRSFIVSVCVQFFVFWHT